MNGCFECESLSDNSKLEGRKERRRKRKNRGGNLEGDECGDGNGDLCVKNIFG